MSERKRYLPLPRRFVFRSPLPGDVVAELLTREVDTRPVRFTFDLAYWGKVRGRTFNIGRQSSGRNSFRPTIVGEIVDTPDGCATHVTMRLNHLMLGFLLIWSPPWIIAPIVGLAGSPYGIHPPAFLLPLAPVLLVAIGGWAFNREVGRECAFLERVTGGAAEERTDAS